MRLPSEEVTKLYQSAITLSREPNLRAAIIVSHARTENLIRNICTQYLPILEKQSHRRRVHGLHQMGLIDNAAKILLDEMAELRNAFAHSFEEMDLTHPNVSSHAKNFLTKAKDGFGEDKILPHLKQLFTQALGEHNLQHLPVWISNEATSVLVYSFYLQMHLLKVLYSDQPKFKIVPIKGIDVKFSDLRASD